MEYGTELSAFIREYHALNNLPVICPRRANYFRFLMGKRDSPMARRSASDPNTKYAVIFDAGSTKTEANVFTFTMQGSERSTLRIISDQTSSSKPGIATKKPEDIAAYLQPL